MLRVGFESHDCPRDATHEQHDGCGVEEGAAEAMVASKSFASRPIAPDPGEEPLDNPAPRLNSEADLIGVLAHDLDGDAAWRWRQLSPAYPPSAKTRWMKGKIRREACRSGPPPSRSWMLAGCGSSTRPRPSVSTSAWRLRPLICRVEEGRGEPRARPVSRPRSSNRTCGFPASGFPTGFIARPTATTVRARVEGTARPVLRRHAHGRTGRCHALALCAVDGGSSCARS